MPHPEGYRKALRLMKQAEKFNRPVICFVDTPGAFCGLGAEQRGQGEAIAKNLMEMMMLRTPTISIIIGEGGSGGALALGVADKVYMLENSIYSILSPEGFASILWKDSSRAKEASEVMKLTAEDLKKYNIIDDIIQEPRGGAHLDLAQMSHSIKEVILTDLKELTKESKDSLLEKRYNKFRKMGI
jgi:acetyl-CoA carboxylase carboxyl transferase subunit alpha